MRASIFIDGAYYTKLQHLYATFFDFGKFVAETLRATKLEEIAHIFYYDCLPLPTPELQDRTAKKLRYFDFLRTQPGTIVREGRLALRTTDDGQRIVVQKRVDLLLGLDIAEECSKRVINSIVLVSGDEDFIPAIEFASKRGVATYLLHPTDSTLFSGRLWAACDSRTIITKEFVEKAKRSSIQNSSQVENHSEPI